MRDAVHERAREGGRGRECSQGGGREGRSERGSGERRFAPSGNASTAGKLRHRV